MNVNSLSIGQKNANSNDIDETMYLQLRLDHEVPVEHQPIPVTTDKENNKNILNNEYPMAGHQNHQPVDNGVTQTKATVRKAGPSATANLTSTSTSNAVAIRSFQVAEEYRKRKEHRMAKLVEEERKKRLHVANPMPNFKAIHSKALSKEPIETCILSPETPEVLRRGLATREKLKKKKEEYDAMLAERPAIMARSASVLQKEPFEPKKTTHTLKVAPFALKMGERLKERKQWDEKYEREVSLRKQKEQQEKEEQEARMRKLIRQQTAFKAKPNPFKRNQDINNDK